MMTRINTEESAGVRNVAKRGWAMNSDKVIYVLIAFQSVIMTFCAIEGNWNKFFFWLGAATINVSIVWGMK